MDLTREQLTGLQFVGDCNVLVEQPSGFQNILHGVMSSLLLGGRVGLGLCLHFKPVLHMFTSVS